MNVGEAVRGARRARGLSQAALGNLVGVSRQAINGLEQGRGSVRILEAALPHIDLKISGLAAGGTLAEQLCAARTRRGWSKELLALRTGVSVPTIRALERGAGTVPPLAAVIAALAPNARPRKSRQAHWQQRGDSRFTPPAIINAVIDAFGPISVDPCADPRAFVVADRYIYAAEDGLTSLWSGKCAWVNPPFSDHSTWIRRCYKAVYSGEVATVVAMLAARIETRAFHDCVLARADLIIPQGKPRFYDENGHLMTIAPFAVLFAIWGADRERVRAFAFSVGGAVVWASSVIPAADHAEDRL